MLHLLPSFTSIIARDGLLAEIISYRSFLAFFMVYIPMKHAHGFWRIGKFGPHKWLFYCYADLFCNKDPLVFYSLDLGAFFILISKRELINVESAQEYTSHIQRALDKITREYTKKYSLPHPSSNPSMKSTKCVYPPPIYQHREIVKEDIF